MSRLLVAMSGGVDSSVAAALAVEAGHQVTGVTLKLWGGESDSGCCSVSDVEDARRVAHQLGIDHHVFNFGEDFERHVVDPFVDAWANGTTPNPCVECNRHIKFDLLLRRADLLGFETIATGHHARLVEHAGERRLARGADAAKDQSYVLHMLGAEQRARLELPVGHLTKAEVRAEAERFGFDTAAKPDSQDVCFIHSDGGKAKFLGDRIPLRSGRIVDTEGTELGTVERVQLVTIGQRKGLDLGGGQGRRYVVDTDPSTDTVVVGDRAALLRAEQPVEAWQWVVDPDLVGGELAAQVSAHGGPRAVASIEADRVVWAESEQRVAPGQAIVGYDGDTVVGWGLAA